MKPGRETLYRGIKMRSRLEADYAAYLDQRDFEWEYEPTCFAGPDGQWLPDFRSNNIVYTEVKPVYLLERQPSENAPDVVERIDKLLRQMSVAWLSEPHAYLHLVFWSYGADAPTFKITGQRETPWLTTPSPVIGVPAVWIGMDQFACTDGTNYAGEPAGPCPRCTPRSEAS